jgi:hypothetical protein
MPPSSKELQADIGRVFWRTFLLVFLLREVIVWNWLLARVPLRRRVLILLLWPGGTVRSVFMALFAAAFFTLLLVLVVRLIITPALNLWLKPAIDPSEWMFHLAASESPVAISRARRKSGSRWQPGALVLTDRRLWFFPSVWYHEPWSLACKDLDRLEPVPAPIATLAPIRNWPARLRFSSPARDESTFAVADPDAVLAWFRPATNQDESRAAPGATRQGVFDA